MIEYSSGFRSDHYCERGHVLLVLQGELCIRLKNGSEHRLVTGMSIQVADDTINPHLASTETGAKVFVVD
jgi:quercetin dioxygenase-like cupin family protein